VQVKSGLAPTGVFRQILVLHKQFRYLIYARVRQKTNRRAFGIRAWPSDKG